jgi:hypothetical protein
MNFNVASLSRDFTRNCDTLWINDSTIGALLLSPRNVAYEYLAIQPPVVATPTSGIQNPSISGLLIETDAFANAVELGTQRRETFLRQEQDRDDRARQLAAALTEPSRRG